MKRFKEYLNEKVHVEIDVDSNTWLPQLAKANEDLEKVTLEPFVNSAIFTNAVRGTLERYGIVLPAHSNMQQLSMESEVVYILGDTGYFVYMVHNLSPTGHVEGYAQIVNEDELDDLDAPHSNEEEVPEEPEPVRKPWIPPARRDDDSGNNDEYT